MAEKEQETEKRRESANDLDSSSDEKVVDDSEKANGGKSENENEENTPFGITSEQRGPGLQFYKGRPGLWAYSLHRITGTAIFLFLLIHIADVAAVGWGRDAYNTVHELYETLFFRILEVGLFGALLLHAINGMRVAIVDFWSEGADRQETITAWAIFAFIVLFLPGAAWMLYNFFATSS